MQMRRYHIYLIKKEFAEHFFGQEYKLFQLFSEAGLSSDPELLIAQKQASFVKEEIDTIKINQLFTKALIHKHEEYSVLGNSHLLYRKKSESSAKCTVLGREIIIEATGSFETETTFFEVLRKHSSYYLAIDFQHERYGWLNPIKQKTYV
jgi:hypothetical protein